MSSLPGRLLMTLLQTYRSTPSWQGKGLLAAAVNKLPYAPVGVSAQPTHFSNIQYTEIL